MRTNGFSISYALFFPNTDPLGGLSERSNCEVRLGGEFLLQPRTNVQLQKWPISRRPRSSTTKEFFWRYLNAGIKPTGYVHSDDSPQRKNRPHEGRRTAAYFQLFMAFLCSDSGPSSDSSIRMPSGPVALAITEFVREARGSSTLTPCCARRARVARMFSTCNPRWLIPGRRSAPAGCTSMKLSRLTWT